MRDVFGVPQSVLIIGGNSDIGFAVLKMLVSFNRLRQVCIVTRSGIWNHHDEFENLTKLVPVQTSVFSMDQFSASRTLQEIEIDLAIVATGYLPNRNSLSIENIRESLEANLVVPCRLTSEIALQMQKQAFGTIVGLSSISAVRVRPDNWIYGFAKSAFDSFLQNLSRELNGSGVSILTVRPGMVRTKMSQHLQDAPFTVDPEDVATAIKKRLHRPSSVVWVPTKLRVVGWILRVLPGFVLQRLRS
jgi:decaprenylphospho-beta-D-erythro-pentofuranosid-2-ulose 2-reductase